VVKGATLRSGFVLAAVVVAIFFSRDVRGEDWIFYGGSGQEDVEEWMFRDRYVLNKLKLVPESEARTLHYFDQDSAASSSPFPGGIVRVWEKSVLRKLTKSYDEARKEIEREEEKRLGRKLTVLDFAQVFPLAVNRATKETTTLFEINCDSKEFFIMEVNNYDKEGKRMTRETTMAMDLWFHIQPGTMVEALSRKVCEE
jgi:hypothetical protein